jgi:membrane-associated protein
MFDLAHLVQLYGPIFGYLLLAIIIFAETGLFFGFFLPGDSILFPAGILASQGYLNIYTICIIAFIAAVIGNVVGYFFGKRVGPRLFAKEDSLLFKKHHVTRAKHFYDKHGKKTIILARFVPIIRTFGPIVAGVSDMVFGDFVIFSAIGAVLWAVGVPIAGFYLGRMIPDIDKYLLPVIGLVIFLSILPAIIEVFKTKENRKKMLVLVLSVVGWKK